MFQRGDVVLCLLSGDYGKPRPAIIVQSNLFNPTHVSFTICPLTTYQIDASLFRIPVPPDPQNGLHASSQIMVDKISSLKKEKIHEKIGTLQKDLIYTLNTAIKLWLDVN